MDKNIKIYESDFEDYSIHKLIEYYKNIGVFLWVDNGKLKYRGPKEKIDKEFLSSLKKGKERIIKYMEYRNNNTFSENFRLTPIQYAYVIGRSPDYELGNINAHYYTEYSCNNISVDKLQNIINKIIKKHDALRTIIYESGYQNVMSEVPELVIPVSNFDEDSTIKEIRGKWSHHMYPLGTWPMFHFEVSKRKDNKDILHVSFDCILLDAWSARLMLIEIFELYNGKVVENLSFTFKEYLKKEQDYLQNDESCIKAKSYWKEVLNTLPKCPCIPINKQFSLIEKPCFCRLEYKFGFDETKALYDKIKEYHFTPSSLVCTVFMKVLSFYSKNKDLTLNLTLFNRVPINKEISRVLGDFTNIGLVPYFYDENLNFKDEVKDIQKRFWKLIQYRTYDGTKLLKTLSKDNLGKAIMPVVFTSMLEGCLENETTNGFKEVYAISQTPQVVLDHQARDDNGGLALSWDYVLEAFDPEIIQKMFFTYIETIKKVISEESWDSSIFVNNINT